MATRRLGFVRSWRGRGLLTVCVCAAVLAPAGHAAGRDDTAWLQARLDAGGTLELPRLPGGACYRTRGLWISRDDTTIASPDGACVVALGLGEKRLTDGPTPGRADAAFFVSNSSVFKPLPVRVSIRGVHVIVPARTRMAGITVLGHEVTVDHVVVSGEPSADVVVGSALGGAAERVSILDSQLSGAVDDVVSAFGVIDLRLVGNTLMGGRRSDKGRPAAGLHLRPSSRGQPTLNVQATGNTITRNAGEGVLLGLRAPNGLPVVATGISITGNRITRNGGAAIRLVGGQRDDHGTVALEGNVLSGNGGGIVRVRAADPPTPPGRWQPSAAILARAGIDDTSWLQARLDAGGGTIFLPALPNGRCYATRGLWVWHDDTHVESDGACIVALGPGPVRLRSTDGDPIASTAVFYVNRAPIRGRLLSPAPTDVTIGDLAIDVPAHLGMYGVFVAGHDVTLSRLTISGDPIDDVNIGGRANGTGFVNDVSVVDSTLQGAQRNGISATGVIGLDVERNTIAGVQDTPGQPGAGIDVEPDDRAMPTLDVAIRNNMIRDNAGPGVLVSLQPNTGPSILASGIEISGNTILRNATRPLSYTRAGIAIVGGEEDGAGTLLLKDNTLDANGGSPILIEGSRLVVTQTGNSVR